MSVRKTRATSKKQQKITSLFSQVKNISNATSASSSRHVSKEKSKNPYDKFYSDVDEDDLPVRFNAFDAYSNLTELVIDHIKKVDGPESKRSLKIRKHVNNYKMVFYKGFYTRPERRSLDPLNKLQINENAPTRLRAAFFEVPEQYKHRLSMQKHKKHKSSKNKENKQVNNDVEDMREADIHNPQPSTSKSAPQLLENCKTTATFDLENKRIRTALNLLHEMRTYTDKATTYFPVTFHFFQRCVQLDKIVEKIICDATVGDAVKCKKYLQDKNLRERIAHNYYAAFYESAEITRLLYEPTFNPCPSFAKLKILKTVEDNTSCTSEQTAESNTSLTLATAIAQNNCVQEEEISDVSNVAETIEECSEKQPENVDIENQDLKNAYVEQFTEINSNTSSCKTARRRSASVTKEIPPQAKRHKIACAAASVEIDAAHAEFLQQLNNLPTNVLELEAKLPATFEQFISNTNLLLMINDNLNLKNADSDIMALAHKIYLKYYTDAQFRKHDYLHNLFLRSDFASRLLEFPAQTDCDKTIIIENVFLRPVKNIEVFETAFGISLEEFKVCIDVDKLLNNILNIMASDQRANVIENPDLCETIIQNCYVQLFASRQFRDAVQIDVMPEYNELFEKKLSEHENQKYQTDMPKNPEVTNKTHTAVKTEAATQATTQRLLVRKNNLAKYLPRYIKGKVPNEKEQEVLKRFSLYITKPMQANKVIIESVQVLPPADDVNYTLEKLYHKCLQKPYTIEYMLKNNKGNKLSLLNAVLEMNFAEFQQYIKIYDGEINYQNLQWCKTFYKFTFTDGKIWPPNLYLPLSALIDYLLIKYKTTFKPLTLDCISPMLLHYKDLRECTNFTLCAFENNLEKLRQSTAQEIDTKCEEFYKTCYLNDTWNNYTPSITDENIRKKILEFEARAEPQESINNENTEELSATAIVQQSKELESAKRPENALLIPKQSSSLALQCEKNISKNTLSNKKLAELYNDCETPDILGTESFNIQSKAKAQKIQSSPNLFSSSGSTATTAASQSQPEQAIEITNCNKTEDNNDQNQTKSAIETALNVDNANISIQQSETLYDMPHTNDQSSSERCDPLGTQNLLQQLSTTSNGKRIVMSQLKTHIKQEPVTFLDKLYFSISDDHDESMRCMRLEDEILILDSIDASLSDMLNVSGSATHAIAFGPSTQEAIDNACTQTSNNFRETQQLTDSVSLSNNSPIATAAESALQNADEHNSTVIQLPMCPIRFRIQPSKAKSTAKPVSKSARQTDFVPQLTHGFRPLPLKTVNANVQNNQNECVEPTYSTSQELAKDLTLFNSSQLLQRVLSTNSKTTGNTVTANKQVERIQNPKTISLHPPYKYSELLLYRHISSFDYFNRLTCAQVMEYALPVVAAGQSYMQAVIHDGQRKTLLHGDNLAGLFSYYQPDTLKSLRCLLSSIDEFHYRDSGTDARKLNKNPIDDLRSEILTAIFRNDAHIAPSILSFDNNVRDYAACIPLRNAKWPAEQPVPLLPTTNAIEPHILKRLCEPYKPLNQAK